jgi:hypothetical protein
MRTLHRLVSTFRLLTPGSRNLKDELQGQRRSILSQNPLAYLCLEVVVAVTFWALS